MQRLTQIAELMDLPAPDLAGWRQAIDVAARQWAASSDAEGALRLIYSRGREGGTAPTAYVMVNALPDRVAAVRREALAGDHAGSWLAGPPGADAMPWLLAGAKTPVVRGEHGGLAPCCREGAGDVIFVSSDGYILEGPRSTVVIAASDGRGGDLCLLTPPPWYPILRGTTQQALFGSPAPRATTVTTARCGLPTCNAPKGSGWFRA